MEHFGKPGIINRLEQLDLDLLSIVGDGKRIEITIVGGSALMMLHLNEIQTYANSMEKSE